MANNPKWQTDAGTAGIWYNVIRHYTGPERFLGEADSPFCGLMKRAWDMSAAQGDILTRRGTWTLLRK
jgi:hypothetical protein